MNQNNHTTQKEGDFMLKYKKMFSFIMVLFFALGFNSFVANASENNELTVAQKEQLEQLGFSEQNIASMTIEEYLQFENVIAAEPSVKEETFYKITTDQEGNVINIEEYDEQDTIRLMNIDDFMIQPLSSNTSNTAKTSWMSMTTTSTKLTNGRILLQNSFSWLKNPVVGFTDMVGMNYSDKVVIEPSTVKFSYKYTDGIGQHTKSYTNLDYNTNGIAATFDLRVVGQNAGTSNHYGYLAVEVKKGNVNDVSANAYGRYTHSTLSFTVALAIRSGDISLGLATAESKMTGTAIVFDF
ncbi:hypothetical protein ABIA69_003911 [Lysinibacillus parviboronicapiens]|uniref:Uncharacterized protein n=1 Tax=Lysinibacillus parviboronicapiens TaxID=436516 RepID=A0ABV2PP39_9BACI